MAAVGLAWFIDDLGWIYQPVPYSVARFAGSLFEPMLAHLAVAFPSGHLRTRLDRTVVIATYGVWLLTSLGLTLFWDPMDAGCPACPQNLLMVQRDPAAHDLAESIGTGLTLATTLLMLALVIRHWFTASVASRRAIAPVMWASVPLTAAVVVYSLIGRSLVPPLAPIALASLPIAFLIGLLRIRLDRAEVGRLVLELGPVDVGLGTTGRSFQQSTRG
jgi:hypothetical protein